jgi:hypothetical protein
MAATRATDSAARGHSRTLAKVSWLYWDRPPTRPTEAVGASGAIFCLRGGPGSPLRRSRPALRARVERRTIAPAHSDRNLTLHTAATEKGEGDGSRELQSPSGPPHPLLGRAAVSQVNGSGSIEVDATRARLLASWPSPRGNGTSP